MKPRTVAVLAVLVAALVAFIWFVERDLPSSEDRAEKAKTLLPFETADVIGVTIEWDGRIVRMERTIPEEVEDEGGETAATVPTGADWRLVEPLEGRADGDEVERFLDALAELDSRRLLEDVDPGAVGLDEPRGRVVVRTGEEVRELRIGDEVPTSDDVLVARVSGGRPEQIHVTSGDFVQRLGRDPGTWRDRDLFPATRSTVQRLTLVAPREGGEVGSAEGEAAPVVLARAGESWRIEEPIEDLADVDRVDDVLSELVNLRAERFVDDPRASASTVGEADGFAPVAGVVEAGLQGGGTFRLELGPGTAGPPAEQTEGATPADGSIRLARAGGQLVRVDTDLADLIAADPADWRSRAWTALRSFQVEEIEIAKPSDGAEALRLTRDDGVWRRDGVSIPYTVVSDLLTAVTEAEGDVIDESSVKAEPILELRLVPRQHDPVILTLRATGGGFLGTSSERPAAVWLDVETTEQVRDAVEAVRGAEPTEQPAETETDADS